VRRLLLPAAAAFALFAFAFPSAAASPPVGDKQEAGCGHFGTAVDFVGSPSEAARRAKQEEKLVFVLHVSGHFEDPRFT
jgi:hypothetical protein